MSSRRWDSAVYVSSDFGPAIGDRAVEVSADGCRSTSDLINLRPEKRARVDPSDLEDSFADWTPVEVDDEGLAAADAEAIANTVSTLDVETDEGGDAGKRKRYQSSDNPMSVWRPLAGEFLDWMLRFDGLGDYVNNLTCCCCGEEASEGSGVFRCDQCGPFIQCRNCVLERHRLTPLHCLKEWDGSCWTEARLCGSVGVGLGLVFQLGHHGFPCTFPGEQRSLVVADVNGIFSLQVRYCNCEKAAFTPELRLGQLLGQGWYPATTVDPETCATFQVLGFFRLLGVVGNVTAHDFIGALERTADPTKVNKIPDRYKAFGRMSRQHAFLQRAKRAGRGHVENGLRTTPRGGLAVDCWACPDPARNLPDGWEKVAPEWRFLYMLILALDANFRLKNRIRANEHQDPSLGSGLGYFVESTGYKTHIKNYVAEEDVSTCIAFAALTQKETRLTTGLRVSGVGGCVCARHGVVRPQGIGDLQKGERYANMDYILLSAILGIALLLLAISYDIACQWKIHLAERAKRIAETTDVKVDLDTLEVQFALPVWHANAHESSCQTENSLTYALGVGRTDGEGIERTWSTLNPISYSTKEMGEGARHDAIESKIDHINFEKNVDQGRTLARKLVVAIAERGVQVEAFAGINKALDPELRRKWGGMVEAWQADKTRENPYRRADGKKAGVSEAAVLLELKTAEAEEAAQGRAPLTDGKSTLSSFIKAGLVLEESQRRIKAEIGGTTLVTADRSSQLQELRIALLKKLRSFERLQAVYMPRVADLRAQEEESRNRDAPPPKVEHIKLWLPSQMTEEQRAGCCPSAAANTEAKLRAAQCSDTLDHLRSRLHTRSYLVAWRNGQSTGQHATTRSASLIGRIGERIARLSSKYCDARAALTALKGADYCPEFQILKDEHLTAGLEVEGDETARRKLARLGSAKRAANEPSAKTKGLSWIWVAGGGPGNDEAELQESVRIEWSKAKARRDRWVEEVHLLREEMKRVLRSLSYVQGQWEARRDTPRVADAALASGLEAYANRQIAIHRRIAASFHTGWNVSVATAVRDVVRQDGTIYDGLLRREGVDHAPELGMDGLEEAERTNGGRDAAGGVETETRPRTRARTREEVEGTSG
ncbi:CxC2 domain-containing protein [Favolaschia claudopus]|uniref:CxC2 domain-containing protein n=1 Tax=Favolaschia claudopus TaxID=2862362 RepID=A0AAW0A214_9AGAR